MQSVVVTGISTGIGWGIAKVLSERGIHVFGSVRKQADAERVEQTLGANVTPLLFDVTDAEAVAAAAALVSERLNGTTLAGLVNNAGIAPAGPLQYQPVDEFRRTLEINLVGPLVVTQAFLPLLGADHARSGTGGRIVNISSVGGKLAPPFLGAYAASKHGMEGFSTSLRRELLVHGIDVIVVGPGSVATPIWDKAEQVGSEAYAETEYASALTTYGDVMIGGGRKGLPPEAIGEVVHTALTTARPRTRYAPVQGKLVNWIIPRLLPGRIVDQVLARTFGIKPRASARTRRTG